MKDPYILIMAGGSGTRLWPLSTKKDPKQLLNLYGKQSLLEDTINRCLKITKRKNIFIGTNQQLKKAICKKIKKLNQKNFIIEPEARNTAPIIALFCAQILKSNLDDKRPIVVLSADHYITPTRAWVASLKQVLPHGDEKIWCMGIKPRRPDTGYGYIQLGPAIQNSLYEIKSFKEKPDISTAQTYLSDGNFLWNSGMFIFSARIFWQELEKAEPEMAKLARKCIKNKKSLKKYFAKMKNISVDYAVLEKSQALGVVAADFTWDDVGSYLAIERIVETDENENYNPLTKSTSSKNSQGNTIYTDQVKHICLLGVTDLVVAEKNGVLLIANKKNISAIKEIRALAPEKLH